MFAPVVLDRITLMGPYNRSESVLLGFTLIG